MDSNMMPTAVAPERMHVAHSVYVAMAPFAYGVSADNIDTAVKEAKRRVPKSMLQRGPYSIEVYAVEDFQGVSGLGGIIYKGAKPELVATRQGRVSK